MQTIQFVRNEKLGAERFRPGDVRQVSDEQAAMLEQRGVAVRLGKTAVTNAHESTVDAPAGAFMLIKHPPQ